MNGIDQSLSIDVVETEHSENTDDEKYESFHTPETIHREEYSITDLTPIFSPREQEIRQRKSSVAAAAEQIRQRTQKRIRFLLPPPTPHKYRLADTIPAILLCSLLDLMLGIPFGVSYFPVEWGGDGSSDEGGSNLGAFPIQGKESLGIRMFLFATAIAQLTYTFASGFPNATGLQMVENVPFYHTLAFICIKETGYGNKATLSTLFFLFGLSSVLVGVVFWLLGYFKLGNIIYFFPNHVLIGCIGGIGVFVAIVSIEVTTNCTFTLTKAGLQNFYSKSHLFGLVLLLELFLRFLMYITKNKDGKPRFPLLAPIYYCSITPIFFLTIEFCGWHIDDMSDYFFPGLDEKCTGNCSSSLFDEHLFDIWTIVDFSTISWVAVWKSIPTILSLIAFSLIHVPINIPAFAVSSGRDADMNKELRSHGFSNALSGIFGGLQNYLCYANSVLYAHSGGGGTSSSLLITLTIMLLFLYGPQITSYIPRCMAGTLLLHIGVDLFLEGVYDSYGSFDAFEYSSIWLITIMMSVFGMTTALITGVITALLIYFIQTITYQHPVRGSMFATSLRSSRWNRPPRANAILENKTIGRNKILIIQLQGHLFFGNIKHLTETIQSVLKDTKDSGSTPWIIIVDFSLVLGIDSSAAEAITKLKKSFVSNYDICLAIYVTGSSDGFPCEFDLSQKLQCPNTPSNHNTDDEHRNDVTEETPLVHSKRTTAQENVEENVSLLGAPRRQNSILMREPAVIAPTFPDDFVCESLDTALIFAEDALIALVDPGLLNDTAFQSECEDSFLQPYLPRTKAGDDSINHERLIALDYLSNHCPDENIDQVEKLFDLFQREVCHKNQEIWAEGDRSDCLKLVVGGTFVSTVECDPGANEMITNGSIIGELGLVMSWDRMTTVKCTSDQAIVYSLHRKEWKKLVKDNLVLARCIDLIAVRSLAHKVQHVSNRIFETRCLPI